MERKKLIVIDSNSIIHRAFHALPPLSTKSGELVNAVYGFLLVFLRAVREFQPDYIAAVFDLPQPTFRHKKYKEYKASRPKTPEGICQQIPKIKEALNAFGIQIFEKEGFEADDIIGTISQNITKKYPEVESVILSGDLDVLQLVGLKTKVYSLRKGVKDTILYDRERVKEKYQGLEPEQLIDFKALRGDPSDNIPGVRGVGEKTALELIKEYGSLEQLYRDLKENSKKTEKLKPKLKEILLKNEELAFLSGMLARIEKNAPLDFNLERCRWQGLDRKKIIPILEKFEFHSLIKRLPEATKENSARNLTLL